MAMQFSNSGLVALLKNHRPQKVLCGLSSARLPQRIYLVLFISLLSTNYVLLFCCVVPFVDDDLWVVMLVIQTIAILLQFLSVWLRQPGYIAKA